MKTPILLAIALACGAAGCTSLPSSTAAPSASDAVSGRTCPGYDPANVLAEFPMPHASSYREYLPKMGISPELDNDSEPAYMVIFNGPVATYSGVESNVVCVVQHDGTANLYADVSRDGMTLPGASTPGPSANAADQ